MPFIVDTRIQQVRKYLGLCTDIVKTPGPYQFNTTTLTKEIPYEAYQCLKTLEHLLAIIIVHESINSPIYPS